MITLVLSNVWVEPASSAAGRRMLDILTFFRNQGHKVHYASTAAASEFAVNLSEQDVVSHQIKVNDVSFDEWIANLQPDIVVFDRFMVEEQFGWRVKEFCPNAMRILDSEDLHCLRNARQAALEIDEAFTKAHLIRDIAFREIASIYRSDLTLIISEFEMEVLTGFFEIPADRLVYMPFWSKGPVSSVDFDQRSHFIHIGSYRHAPNKDSLDYLLRAIWPHIRAAIPNAELHVYGSYAKQVDLTKANVKLGVKVLGRAENAHETMSKFKVLLAPIRFGAGLKGKLLDAMECGTPSVTTSIGVEGMSGELTWGGGVEDAPEAFAKKAVELYEREKIWVEAQEDGFKILSERFNQEDHRSKLQLRLHDCLENIEAHRRQSFISQMLHHHTLASSKYMARWIETKNAGNTSASN